MSLSTTSLPPVTPIRFRTSAAEAARAMRDANTTAASISYFVVMMDYGRDGCEAVVDPEITRREVVSRIVSGEYRDIVFIHAIEGGAVTDVTLELQMEASHLAEAA